MLAWILCSPIEFVRKKRQQQARSNLPVNSSPSEYRTRVQRSG